MLNVLSGFVVSEDPEISALLRKTADSILNCRIIDVSGDINKETIIQRIGTDHNRSDPV